MQMDLECFHIRSLEKRFDSEVEIMTKTAEVISHRINFWVAGSAETSGDLLCRCCQYQIRRPEMMAEDRPPCRAGVYRVLHGIYGFCI